jgi:hypothetical protein
MKSVLSVLGVLVFVLGLTWVFQGDDFFLYKTFAPKYEQVRRETFEQSKAYNQGMAQEIQNMQFEYVKSTPEQQKALASIILHRVADYDLNKLPPDTQQFVEQLKRDKELGR